MQRILQYAKKELNNKKQISDAVGTLLVVLITLLFCASMTIAAKSWTGFDHILNLMMLICILYGAAISVIEYRTLDKKILILSMLFIITRLISYMLNDIPIKYGGTLMLQVFYLIGICRQLYGGKKRRLAALYAFLAFDIAAVLACFINYYFRPDHVSRLYAEYMSKGLSPQTSVFQNPNYAGMMTGAAVIVCLALILNNKTNKKYIYRIIPVLFINLIMLVFYTGCRSAQAGFIIVILIATVIGLVKKLDSVRMVIGTALIVCFMTLIPLYALVYSGVNEVHLFDVTDQENIMEELSTGRYAIWKTTILSMKGHELFGYGSSSNAWNKRKDFVNNYPAEYTSEDYYHSTVHKRQHNGYLALVNEAGLVGAACMLLLLLSKIKNLRGRFSDGQWERLLLIYIFWINLLEAKFILHVFFTGFIMMVLLLPPEDEETEI